jgi:4a-hydroxytetrahydrobiopterin dehydratase
MTTQATTTSLSLEHCDPRATKLAAHEVTTLLTEVPGWERHGDKISRSFKFPDYFHTMAFVNAVASVAHREDHHPDLAVFYNRCDVTFSTHSAGGITRNDLVCAARVDSLLASA